MKIEFLKNRLNELNQQIAKSDIFIFQLKQSNFERNIHQKRVQYLKKKLRDYAIPFLDYPSHIVPVILGEAHLCRRAAMLLLEKYNIYVHAFIVVGLPGETIEHRKETLDFVSLKI